jgi:hypothetical protein
LKLAKGNAWRQVTGISKNTNEYYSLGDAINLKFASNMLMKHMHL